MIMDTMRYINVILPLKLGWEPYYSVDEDEQVEIGDRARVSFAGRSYLGVVSGICDSAPEGIRNIKKVFGIDHSKEPVKQSEISFWRTIADYYMCSVGEVYKAAYPSVKDESVSSRKKAEAVPTATECQEARDNIAIIGQIRSHFSAGKTVLLSSGRPDDILLGLSYTLKDKNIIWLVPEIKVTKALEGRLAKIFGDRLVLWGSNLTPAKKRAAQRKVRSGEPYILFGTRSALFLPHHDLGLVIVQDEHEASYKQSAPAPRYNGRDAAIMLATSFKANILLESETPSTESELNVLSGKYAKVHETTGIQPEYLIINTREEARKNGMVGNIPRKLIALATETGDRPCFFKSRRAAFPKTEELLPELKEIFGENVFYTEDLVSNPLPSDCKVLGIFGIDSLLGRNDFRADEKAYQAIGQAVIQSGASNVAIMTREHTHPVFQCISLGIISPLLAERKAFNMAPYARIVDIVINDDYADRAFKMAQRLNSTISAIGCCSTIMTGDGLRLCFPKDNRLKSRKHSIQTLIEDFEKSEKYTGHIHFDVDPL